MPGRGFALTFAGQGSHGAHAMKVWLFIALGLAMLALASWRQFLDRNVTLDERLRCEAVVHADHDADARALAELLPLCARRAMVKMMDARREGAEALTASDALDAAGRQQALSALINLALTGAGIGAFAVAWRRATHGRRRF